MWEEHPGRVRGHAGLPAQRRIQRIGIQVQQYQIPSAGKQPVGRQVYLLNGRKMNETDVGQ